jgi:hypothetical protein
MSTATYITKAMAWTRVGVVASRTGNTLTLWDPNDCLGIHVGMRLRAGVSPGQARVGEFVVHDVDDHTGIVVVKDALAVESFTDNDELYFVAEV